MTQFLRKRLYSIIAILGFLGLSGPAMAQEKITLLLDWFINPDHGPLYIAQEKGYFAEAGLEVEMIEPADPSAPPKLVAAGKADLAVSYQPRLHVQISEGLPLTRVATLVATPLNSLVVLEDGPIQSIADLKGKKIGFSVGGFEDVLLRSMLKKYGLSTDDVEMINVNFSLSPSLISGQVDAVIGAFRNFELNQMDIVGHPGKAFFVEEEGVPIYDELILVAQNASVGNPAIGKLITAIERATAFIINHPDEAWEIFKSVDPAKLDDELNRRAWRDTLPRFALRPGALDEGRYRAFAAFLEAEGMISQPPGLSSYAVEVPR